jgi:octaprenyl-diphosphate synthase
VQEFESEADMDLIDSIQSDMQFIETELIQQLRSRVPVAFEISAHIMNSGGKRIRPQLAVLSARMGGSTGRDALMLSIAIECIHTATLLHDDVVDKADTRRGRPSANTLWSNEMCVLGGDFLLARAFAILTQLNNLRILEIISASAQSLSEGELFQMTHIGNLDLSEEDYFRIIRDKTAVLMEAACRGGAVLGGLDSEKEQALAEYGFNLGISFQMTDDVIDYRSDKDVLGKTPCKDLDEGKLTLPLILALKKADQAERSRIEEMIRDRGPSEADVSWIREFLERRGGISEALERARVYVNKAADRLEVFSDSPEKQALLQLAEKILHRTY